MRICKIWDADYPWDIRVEKVVLSLIQAGHSVELICRNQARRTRRESNGDWTIHRLPLLPPVLGPLHTLSGFPFPINPVWLKAIGSTIRDTRAELVLVRDLPLALPCAILGKIYHIPVVLDMAEDYPAMLADSIKYNSLGHLGRMVRNPAIARFIERLTVRLVDHIIVVAEESRTRLIHAGVPSTKLTVVSNTPKVDQWEIKGLSRGQQFEKEPTKLVYLGGIEGSRGIDVAIRAIGKLKDNGHLVEITVIGDGSTVPYLRELARQTGVSDRVHFVGRLPIHETIAFAQVQDIMTRSHIGLVPHFSTEHTQTTIPNKLFDYMVLGLPVIVSDMKPTARIVREENCGEVFRDRDADDLARCILALIDPQIRAQKGANGQAAVRRKYNWNFDSKILVQTIEKVKDGRVDLLPPA